MTGGVHNLRHANHRDTIDMLLARTGQPLTRASGVKVFGAGESALFESADGQFRALDAQWLDDTQGEIDRAREEVAETATRLEEAETRLEDSRDALAQAAVENSTRFAELDQALANNATAMTELDADMKEVDQRAAAAETAAKLAEANLKATQQRLSLAEEEQRTLDGKLATAKTELAELETDMAAVGSRASAAEVLAKATETQLKAAEGRITTAESSLTSLDGQLKTADGKISALRTDLGTVSTRASAAESLAKTTETQLKAAEGRIKTAEGSLTALDGQLKTADGKIASLSSDMTAVSNRATSASNLADTTAQKLASAENRLTQTEKDIVANTTNIGNVQTAVTASDRKAQEAYNTATAASNSAGTAATAAEAARRNVEVLLASSGSLIIGGDYETEESYQKGFRSFINLAHSGSYALGLPTDSYNYVEHPQVGAQPGALLRGSFFIKKAANADNIGNANPDIIIRAIKRDGTHEYVYPNVKNTPGPLTSAWIEWTFEFPALPENTRFVAPWVRNGYSTVSGGKEKVYIDQALLADTTSYQSAVEEAKAAKAEAVAAAAKAQDAMTAANLATRTADGKSTTTFSMNSPSGMGVAVGDKHFKMSSLGDGGAIVGQWRWNGNVWVSEKVDGSQIANFDAGYITSGFLDVANRIRAGSILADKVMIGTGGNLFPDPTLTNPAMHTGWTSAQIGAAGTGDNPANGSILIASGTTQRGRYFGLQATEEPARVRVTPGSYYHVSVKARTATTSVQNGVAIFVRLYKAGTNDWVFPPEGSNIFLEAGKNTASDAWETISGTFQVSEGYDRVAIGFYAQAAYTGSVRFCAPSVEPAADGELIVDGAITGTKVNAQSVAAAVGQFVKVQASNVEVTQALTARIVEAMTTQTKNLIVTGNASITGKTYIEDLASNVVKATRISTDQLVAGTATFDTATSKKFFAETFTSTNITGMNATLAGTLTTKVVEAMDVRSRNLIVTGNANLTGKTYIEDLAANVIRAASVSTDQLVAGTATFDTATSKKFFAETFTATNITGMNATLAGTLTTKVVEAMDVRSRNLIVTGNANLTGKTYIEDLAANVIRAASVSTDQLTAGTGTMGELTATKIFNETMTSKNISTLNLTVKKTLSAEVVSAMSVESKNLIVTGRTDLTGETYIKDLAATVIKATEISTDQLTAGNANMKTATVDKLFSDIFTAKKITARELYVGSPLNIIPGGWGAKATPPGWSGFGLNTTASHNVGQPSDSSYWVDTRKTPSAEVVMQVEAGQEYHFSVWARANIANSRFYVQLITNGSVSNEYVVSNQIVPNGSWKEFTGTWTPVAGTTEVQKISVYANHTNGAQGGTQWFGAFTLAPKTSGVLIKDDTITAGNLLINDTMTAELVQAMSLATKRLVVTEDAILNQATVVTSITTPLINALETKTNSLLANKASISDLAAGNLTLAGHFRSGRANGPSVIIPSAYDTAAGFNQLGLWFSPNGSAPSIGAEMGATAGLWLDNSGASSTSAAIPLHIRGKNGAGVWVWGDLNVNSGILSTPKNTDLTVWPGFDSSGGTVRQSGLKIRASGIDVVDFSGVMNMTSQGAAEYNAVGALTLRGASGLVLQTNGNIALRKTNGDTYYQSWTGGGLRTVWIGNSSGVLYTDNSSRELKQDIELMEPDHDWLDMNTVYYRDKNAVRIAAEVEARQARGDLTPISAEEFEMIELSKKHVPGRLAEDGAAIGSHQVVYGTDGQKVESWDYSRDGVMLTPHVREHRDAIARLEAKVAELESRMV